MTRWCNNRHVLDYGTNDVTDFYAQLLKRVALPYKELDMARKADRDMMDDLRIRTCILLDVSLKLFWYVCGPV